MSRKGFDNVKIYLDSQDKLFSSLVKIFNIETF